MVDGSSIHTEHGLTRIIRTLAYVWIRHTSPWHLAMVSFRPPVEGTTRPSYKVLYNGSERFLETRSIITRFRTSSRLHQRYCKVARLIRFTKPKMQILDRFSLGVCVGGASRWSERMREMRLGTKEIWVPPDVPRSQKRSLTLVSGASQRWSRSDDCELIYANSIAHL